MDVEVVTDDVPARDRGIGGDDGLHMGQEIFFGARGTTKGGNKLSRHHVATENKATGAMTLVLEFPSLYMAWGQWESGMRACKRLHAGQLIGTQCALTLPGQRRCLAIHCTDRSDALVFLRVCWRREPVADQMRLQIPFLTDERRVVAKSMGRSRAASFPQQFRARSNG